MSLLDGVRHRLYVILRGEHYAREVDREMRFHLDLEALSDKQRDAAERELAPRRILGNVSYYREEVRRMTPLHWLDRVRQDAMYAWRGLKRSPGFTAGVVLTLGLGIGVNAAMFSLLDQLFVRPPAGVVAPHDVHRLYVDVSRPNEPGGRLAYDSFLYPNYRAMLRADSALQIALFTQPDSGAVVQGDTRIPIRRSLVGANYFSLLGVRPQRGRFFSGDEARIESPTPVAVLSDAIWTSAYGKDVSVIGKVVTINSRAFTVIGIAPPAFTGVDLDAVDVWLPANNYQTPYQGPTPWYETFHNSFRLIARASSVREVERLAVIGTTALRSVHLRGFNYDSTATMRSGSILRALGPARNAQELAISTRLAGVALVVLLIACANVANLLLVRATRRQREIAVRRALGVSTVRLYQQLLTESMLLSVIGGATALLFAWWAGTALRRLLLPSNQWATGAMSLRTIAFAGVVCLVVGIVAGLAPALQAGRPDLINSLKAGSREGSYQPSKLRSALLAAQAALSVVLLIGAGLFVRSLDNIHALDLGYDVDHVLFVQPTFASAAPTANEIAAAIPEIAQQLRAAPGVEAVAYASTRPMGGYSVGPILLPDRDSLPVFGSEGGAWMIAVSPDYFRASGVRVVSGRDFSSSDLTAAARTVIVSQAMARTFWPGQNALGKCLILGKRGDPCSIVIGVVADVHQLRVVEEASMQYYVPIASTGSGSASTLIVRASAHDMPNVARIATQELKRAFPRMTFAQTRSMASLLEPQFRPWRLGAILFTAFGILALIVAAIGVYSVVAYAVSQRTHEMGIRIALGARATDIVKLVLGESSRVVIVGVALGIMAAIALGRFVASLLYGVSARDPLVMASAAVLLLAIGVVASVFPGWRAARVDPSTALRAD
jgi:predicted permease